MGNFIFGFAFVAGCATAVLCITGLLLKLFPHSRVSQWIPRLLGEPDTDPDRLLAPAVDAAPRVFLTVVYTGAAAGWPGILTDVDRRVRIADPGHGYACAIEHMWTCAPVDGLPGACWCMRLDPLLQERLLRQLAIFAEDLRTITFTWWTAAPYKVLRTQPSPKGDQPAKRHLRVVWRQP